MQATPQMLVVGAYHLYNDILAYFAFYVAVVTRLNWAVSVIVWLVSSRDMDYDAWIIYAQRRTIIQCSLVLLLTAVSVAINQWRRHFSG